MSQFDRIYKELKDCLAKYEPLSDGVNLSYWFTSEDCYVFIYCDGEKRIPFILDDEDGKFWASGLEESELIFPSITIDTPVEEVAEIHRSIWQCVIDCGSKPDTPYVNDCVLCAYTKLRTDNVLVECQICPTTVDKTHGCLGGLYSEWLVSLIRNDPIKAKETAEKIRDIEIVDKGLGGV